MSAEIKDFLDASELTPENVPSSGNMPDVSISLPWISASGEDNGAVWPWRIFLGAEDDDNRNMVYAWRQVDDLGGITKLWAGVYNGTIYLHAGDEAPAAGEDDDSDFTAAPVAGGEQAEWSTGEPVPPFWPLSIDERDSMLKNDSGQWRRLVWEPVGIFDVATKKTLHEKNEDGEAVVNVDRLTLYMIVEYPFIVFYTSRVNLFDDASMQVGQPARWPFSHYLSEVWGNSSNDTYEKTEAFDFHPGHGFHYQTYMIGDTTYWKQYRLSPLPWQQDGKGELEAEAQPADGVQSGQLYALPPQWPCGRYYGTMNDALINGTLIDAYQDSGAHMEYESITKEEARVAIIDSVKTAATEGWSIDPSLMEEMGMGLPDGAATGSAWQTDPPEYEVVFSYHMDETADRWPHWLALMACHAPTAVLTASACAWYNDFRPAGGWPDDAPGSLPAPDPDDPNDVAPGDEEDDEGGSSSSGGVIPDDPNGSDEDDPETDEDMPDGGGGTPEKHAGYYYRAGDGVTVRADWQPSLEGWRFTVSINAIEIKGSVDYAATLTAVTGNDDQIYDSVYGDGLSMFYGVSVSESSPSTIEVTWKSSGPPNDGQDNLPKKTTVSEDGTCSVAVDVSFEALQLTSKSSPSPFGNILQATADGTITKRFSRRVWDSVTQRYKLVRIAVTYTVYRLHLNPAMYKWLDAYYVTQAPTLTDFAVDAKTTDPKCSADDNYIQGYSDGLTGPNVAAVNGDASPVEDSPEAVVLYGGFSAVAYLHYELKASYSVSGGSSWDAHGPMTGAINGRFEATYKENITRSIKF